MFKFEPEREGGVGRVEPVETTASQEGSYSQYVARPGPLSAVSPLARLYMLPYGCIAHIHGHTHAHIYTHTAIYMHGLGAPVARVSRPEWKNHMRTPFASTETRREGVALAADLCLFAAALCLSVGLAFVLRQASTWPNREGVSHGHRQSNQRR